MTARAPLAALRQRLALFVKRLPRDKSDTLLLLAGALLVLAPHALHLPLWITALSLATMGWRMAITVRGTRLPPAILLVPLASAAVGGIWLTYQTVLGRDAGVAMLVLLVAFKMLEMRARRDLFVVIYLCFFLLLTTFFYAQGIGTALLMMAAIITLFTAQLSFQFTGTPPPLRRRLWLSARLVLLATPLAVLLFVVFPRLQGPLWGMPEDGNAGRTGMSNSMAPGNLAKLAQSDEVAFRVRFFDPLPAPQLLYWRGVVLADFDGRTWTQASAAPAASLSSSSSSLNDAGAVSAIKRSWQGAAVRQQITLEPSGQRWLFALDLAAAAPTLRDAASAQSEAQELSSLDAINQRIRYDAISYPQYRLQAEDALTDAARWLRLPAGSNPRALAAARILQAQVEAPMRVQAVLAMFRQGDFFYTLEPPQLGRDSVDDFLFRTRSGFCEHYASAFVFLMRAAGVPARVVTGYQGGEVNPVDGFMTVRQSDAHAWAEVWLAGSGWVRVDPTAAVAPSRVLSGASRRAGSAPPFGLAALDGLMDFAADRDSLLGRLRFQVAALSNGWNQWVLNYTPERQRSAIEALSAAVTDPRSWAALATAAALAAPLHARRVRRRGDPVDALYSALCLQLARHGVTRASDEGPLAYGRRVDAAALTRARRQAAQAFLGLYTAYKYGAPPAPPRLIATLKHLLTKLR
ncbi:transglutaminaseTgpA domain-containing protein [Massilia sp. PWRC2]|uniref:transglutaminase family protein n=1 Tax=Massilia sp. PWRC2 TaxID=2804626 RepID=UPI003CE9DD8B